MKAYRPSVRTVTLLALLSCVSLATGARAESASGRGVYDSVVSTLCGGNDGDGATNALTIPLGQIAVPTGMARDASGNIFYTDGNRILKQTPAGVVSVICGTNASSGAYLGDGGLAVNALLNAPTYMCTNAAGDLFVVDSGNHRIRKITAATGIITTVAGNGSAANAGHIADIGLPAVDARLSGSNIIGVVVNSTGDIYFADNLVACIYKIPSTTGILSLVAGNGAIGTTASGAAAFGNPIFPIFGLAILPNDQLVYTETNAVRVVDTVANTNTVVAGLVVTPGNFPNNGTAAAIYPDAGANNALVTAAAAAPGAVRNPRQVTVDASTSTIIFFDSNENNIRAFKVGGTISAVFGTQGHPNVAGFQGDGLPAADNNVAVQPADPMGRIGTSALVASGGVVTFADGANRRIRQFTIGGNVNSIAGSFSPYRAFTAGLGAGSGNSYVNSDNVAIPAKGATISIPNQVATDTNGNLYFDATDILSVRKIYKYTAAAQTLQSVAGRALINGFDSNPGDGGPAVGVSLRGLGTQIALDGSGNAFFAEALPPGTATNAQVVRKVDTTGTITTVAGIFGIAGTVDPNVANIAAPTTTRVGKPANTVLFTNPTGIAISGTTMFVAETGGAASNVVQIDLTTGNVTGTQTVVGVTGLVNAAALPANQNLLAVSGTTLLTANIGGTAVQAVNITTGAVTTPIVAVAAGTITALAEGTNGLYVATTADIELYPAVGGALTRAFTGTGGGAQGMTVNGTTVTIAQNPPINIVSTFVDTGVAAAGSFTTVAGQFEFTLSPTTGGPALNTAFSFAATVPIVMSGSNIIVGDGDSAVAGANVLLYRKVTPTAPAPTSTAVGFAGSGNDTNISLVAGNGLTGEGGPASTATLVSAVGGIAISADGSTGFFTDQNLSTVRTFKTDGSSISTFGGIPGHFGFSGNGLDKLLTVFNKPAGIVIDTAGDLFITELGGSPPGVSVDVREIATSGIVSQIAGAPDEIGYAGDDGLALAARFNNPTCLAINPHQDIYVGDDPSSSGPKVIRIIGINGFINTLAGNASGLDVTQVPEPALEASLVGVSSLTVDAGGKVFNCNKQSTIIRTGGGLSLAVVGNGVKGFNGDGLPGVRTYINTPTGVVANSSGLVFTDTGNNRLRLVTNLAETSNTAPQAVITVTPDHLGMAPYKAHFDGTASSDPDGNIVTYAWDLGDGTTFNGPVFDHVYANMGQYVVSLTVTDSGGLTSTVRDTVFSAIPLLNSTATGKGAFKLTFGGKPNADSFSFSVTGVQIPGSATGINLSGQPFTLFLGTFSASGTVSGKGSKKTKPSTLPQTLAAKKGNTTVTVDTTKGTVAASVKSATLAPAFADFGVTASNSALGTRTALVPVVINIGNGTVIFGDKLNFFYKVKVKTNKGKTSGSASGKFSQ